ncbi:MAG: hypothetical protein HYY41_05630, partial [Chloroflexi bacterium]|nr:hypothetical protein [Chloroflexota bacterium]
WYDKRVRQALQMALDRETIIRDYYTGKAEIFNSPTAAFSTWKSAGAYIPLEQLPASARELYKYNPTKAKQLLAEAGYPKGFKMEVITQAATIDELTIIKEQFAKIGVDVEIQVKETGVYTSISRGHTNKHALYGGTGGTSVFDWENYRFGSPQNTANVNDAVVNEGIAEFAKYYMLDDAKAYPIIGKFVPYIVEQSWYIYFPSPYTYTLWWPWVKNFHGEWVIGVAAKWGFTEYIWIDQSLKKSMGF